MVLRKSFSSCVALSATVLVASLAANSAQADPRAESYAVHGLAVVGQPGQERVASVSRWSGTYGSGAIYNRPEPAFAPAPQPQAYAPQQMSYAPQQMAYAPAQAVAASALDLSREMDPAFARAEVTYNGPHRPGTIVIDTPKRFLYLVEPGGRAIRYGIGVGRPGFEWAGVKHVSRKAQWPDWTPPPEMLKRRPDLPRHMKGGPENPLGARALYLGSSLYRIHGTNEPWTIGQNVSSGCIRLMNEDVEDLYSRVRTGAKVIVI
jgi:lipoprotein-anchoring transpeptidase ErfK/SrfK